MVTNRSPELDALALEGLSIGDVRSAAFFLAAGGSLALSGAAGIDGPALDGLVAAVLDPTHPVARALTDPGPTFDVLPMNPGGPKLRSHLPLRRAGASPPEPAIGVLALAHEEPTSEADRAALVDLAARAAALPAT
jgi:hypothetical protein